MIKYLLDFLSHCIGILVYLSLLGFSLEAFELDTPEMRQLPISFRGRIRPLEGYARLWLQEIYGNETLSRADRETFQIPSGSAVELLLRIHFLGHVPWDHAPLFKISPQILQALQLEVDETHVSYQALHEAIYKNPETNLSFLKPLLMTHFWNAYQSPLNRTRNSKQELRSLTPGLVVVYKDNQLLIAEVPPHPPWNLLKVGESILTGVSQFDFKTLKSVSDQTLKLLHQMQQYRQLGNRNQMHEREWLKELDRLKANGEAPDQIADELSRKFPFYERLISGDPLLHLLPAHREGVWLPLTALNLKVYDPNLEAVVPVSNFTVYSDQQFDLVQKSYLALGDAIVQHHHAVIPSLVEQLTRAMNAGYQVLAGTLAIEAAGKVLTYPKSIKLQTEVVYYKTPLAPLMLGLYLLSALTLICSYSWKKHALTCTGILLLGVAFAAHTALLFLRSYLLNRPPVSNMFETLVYVPWITVLMSLLLYMKIRYRILLIASAIGASILLLLLSATALHHELENVQPVLDSQYWLIIHVLLVVGSYGTFALAGILGHLYLIWSMVRTIETTTMRFLAKSILQALYMGVAMLIPGTILGGVWAAESWGRFWDWDPKESWAFISICLYLIQIHLFRYQKIGHFGLAMGAVVGFLAISFTWYGVNYILGTGLHSYGFGSGGELYYYLFVSGELLFISSASLVYLKKRSQFANLLDK